MTGIDSDTPSGDLGECDIVDNYSSDQLQVPSFKSSQLKERATESSVSIRELPYVNVHTCQFVNVSGLNVYISICGACLDMVYACQFVKRV